MATDFDGVINTFPDSKVLLRGGIKMVGSWMKDSDPRKPIYSMENSFVLDGKKTMRVRDEDDYGVSKYKVRYSTELIENITGLMEHDVIDFMWLTTWQDYTSSLDTAFGWKGKTSTAQWKPRGSWISQDAKVDFLLGLVKECDADALLWIDDEMASKELYERILAKSQFPLLAVRPDDRIGISRPQWQRVIEFIDSPSSGFVPPLIQRELISHKGL